MIKRCDFNINDLENLEKNGYNFIVKAKDNFLSNWGESENKAHVQLIALQTYDEVCKLVNYMLTHKNEFSYVNYYKITDEKLIKSTIRNKTYTLRNDWIRGLD